MRTKVTKITGILLTLVMMVSLLGLFSLTASAADRRNAETWGEYSDGNVYTYADFSPFAGNSMGGTPAAPYEISTPAQLAGFAALVNAHNGSTVTLTDAMGNTATATDFFANGASQHVKLTADIDLSGHDWIPIGAGENNTFGGVFDGAGYTISGLSIESSTVNYAGLFGYVTGGTVKNVGVSGEIKVTLSSGNAYVGGLVGYANAVTIENCYSTCNLNGSSINTYVGGLAGRVSHTTITNSYNTGSVSGTGRTNSAAGGLVGIVASATITNCYSACDVSGNVAGGCIGQVGSMATITDCYWYAGDLQKAVGEGTTNGSSMELMQDQMKGAAGKTDSSWEMIEILGNTGSLVDALNKWVESNTAYSPWHIHYGEYPTFGAINDVYEPAILVTNENYESLGLTDGHVGYYAIGNADQLYWFAWLENTVGSGRQDTKSDMGWYSIMDNAVLTADITVNENVLATVYAQDFDPATTTLRAWDPISLPNDNVYLGTFDGNGHTISGLYFNDSNTNYVGLFGCLETSTDAHGTVKDLGLTDSYFKGGDLVGSVVGYSTGEVKNCYHEGVVIGNNDVGGIVGNNDGTVQNCYNVGTVSGNDYFGYVIGDTTSRSTVDNCYYLSDLESDDIDGTTAKNALQFASGEVAHLLGSAWGQTIGTDAYPVFATASNKVYRNVLGGCTESTYTVEYSNTEKALNYTHAWFNENGFCTECDQGEPATLNSEGYYEIDNAGKLFWFAQQVNGGNTEINGKLIKDIDVNPDYTFKDNGTVTKGGIAVTEGWRDWTPIGNSEYMYDGIFDGNDYTVSGLYFNDIDVEYVALFGYVGVDGKVMSLGVKASYFNGKNHVGGVVGMNQGTVQHCYNTGTVGSDYSNCKSIGGVVGFNSKTVENCYNTGTVFCLGMQNVGGVVGFNSGTVKNCYNTGDISGTGQLIGGVVGFNSGAVENCYNTGSVSGKKSVGGVVGSNSMGSVTNCYYLIGCAKDGDYVVQFGIGNTTQGSTLADTAGTTTGMEAEHFASGMVAYYLNGGVTNGTQAFYQTVGTGTPALSGNTVYYGYLSCADDAVMVYTNDSAATAAKPEHSIDANSVVDKGDGTHSFTCTVCGTVTEDHTFTDGVCTVCDYACKHNDFNSATGECLVCELSIAIAKVETGGTTTYYLTAGELQTAVENNSADQAVTLLADLTIEKLSFYATGTKNTLDLNGHTLTGSNNLMKLIGVDGCELAIIGTGSIDFANCGLMHVYNEGAKIVVGSDVTLNGILSNNNGGILDLSVAKIPSEGVTVSLYAENATYNVSDVLLLPEDHYFFVDGVAVHSYSETTEGTVLKHTEHSYTYTASGGATHDVICSVCLKVVVDNQAHSLTYTASGNVITESCSVSCGHTATATISATDATYDGNLKETAIVENSSGSWFGGSLPEISYENNVNAGTATASITIGEATASVDFTIAKATPVVTPPTPREGMSFNDTYFTLFAQTAQTTGGKLMYKVNDGEWGNDTVLQNKWPSGTYTVYYKVEGDENYMSVAEAHITVTVLQQELDKIDLTVTLSSESFVYDGAAKTPAVSIVAALTDYSPTVTLVADKDFTVTYSGNVNAGTATVTIQGIGNFKGTVTKTFTISKASLTITADDKSVCARSALPALTYTVEGLIDGDALPIEVTLTTQADVETVDTYDITVSGAETSGNYNITYKSGRLTVLSHTDTNNDHICENLCGISIGTHEDTNRDHRCDYGCTIALGACEDTDKDHACDYGCDKVYGTHGAETGKHNCAYCGASLSTCKDDDNNHKCDICQAELTHNYSTEWKSDGTNHWHECSCGTKTDVVTHTAGEKATHTTAQTCTVCGYELQAALDHSHSAEWKSDNTNHWHECSCGDKTDVTAHTSGEEATAISDQVCIICYYVISQRTGEEVNVPANFGTEATEIKITVDADNDIVYINEIDASYIENAINDSNENITVEIDLSVINRDIDSVVLSVTTLERILDSAEKANTEKETVTIRLSDGAVELDDKTIKAIVEQAEGNSISLVLESVGTERLNELQNNALEGLTVYGGYEAYFYCHIGEKRISDFNGGVATLSVLFDLPEGVGADKLSVWHIADDGTKEKLTSWYEDGTLYWDVSHFSDFVIAAEGEPQQDTDSILGGDPTEPDSSFQWWIIPIIAVAVGGGGFAIYWLVIKKKTRADLI